MWKRAIRYTFSVIFKRILNTYSYMTKFYFIIWVDNLFNFANYREIICFGIQEKHTILDRSWFLFFNSRFSFLDILRWLALMMLLLWHHFPFSWSSICPWPIFHIWVNINIWHRMVETTNTKSGDGTNIYCSILNMRCQGIVK